MTKKAPANETQTTAPAPDAEPVAPEALEASASTAAPSPARTYPDGYRTWLYSPECPEGRIFVGAEATKALTEGWVETPPSR